MARQVKLLLLVLLAGACAQTEGLDDFDGPRRDGGPADAPLFDFPDARDLVDARPPIDARTPKGFNETCADKADCQSGICLLFGHYCSVFCAGSSCPEGFGCYDVSGGVEPGQVDSICVRDLNVLCTPCTRNEECTSLGVDLCLGAATGGRYCARDCSVASCPTGYQCQQVATGDAGTARQCVPVSGACDCNSMTTGATKPCEVPTPFGTCMASRTCLGGAGWSECQAAATDLPDGLFADENCDGIDGDITDGIFVAIAANGGEDNADCGVNYLNPCLTISNGARRAALLGKHFVYVQAGTYNEVVIMRDGVSIFGGYDRKWQRADRASVGHEVRIEGGLYSIDSQYVAVVAHDLTTPTTLGDLTLIGGNAEGSANRSGRSSYGIHVADAQLRLERLAVNAGQGAPGQSSGRGLDAPQVEAVPGMIGGGGGNGHEGASTCDNTSRGGGGAPGMNACGNYASGSPTGGFGGSGGTMDTSCTIGLCSGSGCNATPGDTGSVASRSVPNQYGYGGFGGSGENECGFPGAGGGGQVANGAGGAGGLSGGRIANRYWYAFSGVDGQIGLHGGGGGGGGGSGGCDNGTDSYGAGGGGGGAGGCAAPGVGVGGEGGGGSFGIFIFRSQVTLRNVLIEQANGADGGAGGTGGRGQSGGAGGGGGIHDGDDKDGGRGGSGGHGGHGGGGGGGAGGVSYGLYTSQSTVDQDGSTIIHESGVSAGVGGEPGGSAPEAPLPERDGNWGTRGASGTKGTSYDCANWSQCGP